MRVGLNLDLAPNAWLLEANTLGEANKLAGAELQVTGRRFPFEHAPCEPASWSMVLSRVSANLINRGFSGKLSKRCLRSRKIASSGLPWHSSALTQVLDASFLLFLTNKRITWFSKIKFEREWTETIWVNCFVLVRGLMFKEFYWNYQEKSDKVRDWK